MLVIRKKHHCGINISPRFPARCVRIDPEIFDKLQNIQLSLPENLDITLTRGYEAPESALGISRKLLRAIGKVFFLIAYPSRLQEISEIFVPNGHDKNGRHIDISISIDSKTLKWLPYGVFTPPRLVAKVEQEYGEVISLLENMLVTNGGQFHKNSLERLQMHIDFE
jgi:hypothetical protein